MNTRLLLKLIVVLAVLLFMVMMGMSNNRVIPFKLLGKEITETRSAFMYFIFYGAGVFSGALLAVGWRSGK